MPPQPLVVHIAFLHPDGDAGLEGSGDGQFDVADIGRLLIEPSYP